MWLLVTKDAVTHKKLLIESNELFVTLKSFSITHEIDIVPERGFERQKGL